MEGFYAGGTDENVDEEYNVEFFDPRKLSGIRRERAESRPGQNNSF